MAWIVKGPLPRDAMSVVMLSRLDCRGSVESRLYFEDYLRGTVLC